MLALVSYVMAAVNEKLSRPEDKPTAKHRDGTKGKRRRPRAPQGKRRRP